MTERSDSSREALNNSPRAPLVYLRDGCRDAAAVVILVAAEETTFSRP